MAVLQLVARREATADGGLHDLLQQAGITDEAYRDYVRGVLLNDAFRAHFEDEVVVSPVAQQRVAQILIAPRTGTVVPQERARHILVQPDPELDDQAEATNEQWDAALEEARRLGIGIHEGVYAAMHGPSYETPAEIRALRTLGADLVGMSTVPEVIAARQMGLGVLAISCVTNMAAGILDRPIDHAEVLRVGEQVKGQFVGLLRAVLPRIERLVESGDAGGR